MKQISTQLLVFIFFISLSAIGFQNCSQNQDDELGLNSSAPHGLSSNANGNTYEGKLTLRAPHHMSPGETVSIFVSGGTSPYRLNSNLPDSRLVQVSEQEFQLTLSANTTASQVQVLAEDALQEQTSTVIRIWGVNKWYFFDPAGIDSDSRGHLYFTEKSLPGITILDENGGFIKRIYSFSIPNLELFEPKDIELFSNGNFVFTDTTPMGHDFFNIVNPNTDQLVAKVTAQESFNWQNCGGIQHIDIDSADRIYAVCETALYVFGPDGSFIKSFNIDNSQESKITSLMILSEDRLLIARGTGLLQTYSISSEELLFSSQVHGRDQSVIDRLRIIDLVQISDAQGIFITRNGKLSYAWVFDINTGEIINFIKGDSEVRLHSIDFSGVTFIPETQEIITTSPLYEGIHFHNIQNNYRLTHYYGPSSHDVRAFYRPKGVHITKDNLISIVDNYNYRISQFDRNGQVIATDYGNGQISRWAKFSLDVTLDSSGTIYAPNTWDSVIEVVEGQNYWRFGEGLLNNPQGIAVSPDNKIYVADTHNHSVKVFSTRGQFLFELEGRSSHETRPEDILFIDGKAYVLNAGTGEILIYSLSGQFEKVFYKAPVGDPASIHRTTEFAFDPTTDQLYILDSKRHRVLVFSKSGAFKGSFGQYGTRLGEFRNPMGIAVDSFGFIYIVDTDNSRIQIFPPFKN